MYIVKVMKRKDASSVVLAVFTGVALLNMLQAVTGRLSAWLSGIENSQYYSLNTLDGDWKDLYLRPVVHFLLLLVALEVLLRLVVWVRPFFVRKR